MGGAGDGPARGSGSSSSTDSGTDGSGERDEEMEGELLAGVRRGQVWSVGMVQLGVQLGWVGVPCHAVSEGSGCGQPPV
eukprot:340668-Chlamydomonas_euryale.AAC.4